VRCSATVQQPDVDEAMRLIAMSKASLYATDENEGRSVRMRMRFSFPWEGRWASHSRGRLVGPSRPKDPSSVVYDIILELAQENESNEASYADALARTVRKGYKQSDLDDALREYADLNVWVVSRDRTKIRLVNDLAMDTA
jgi:DNA replication licensing factor MCM7